jgi:hypothetical protein
VRDGAVGREFLVVGGGGETGVAVVAVTAGFGELLAEVSEQELATAARAFRVPTHHLDPRPDQALLALGNLHCALHRIGRVQVGIEVLEPAIVGRSDGSGLLQQDASPSRPARPICW